MESGTAVIVDDMSTDPRVQQPAAALDRLGGGLFVPLAVGQMVVGALLVGRRKGDLRFTGGEVRFLQTFVDRAATAWQFARAQEELCHLAILRDEERIGRELHRSVVARLLRTGIALGAARSLGSSPELGQRIDRVIADVDEAIAQIRATVFAPVSEERTRSGCVLPGPMARNQGSSSSGTTALVRWPSLLGVSSGDGTRPQSS